MEGAVGSSTYERVLLNTPESVRDVVRDLVNEFSQDDNLRGGRLRRRFSEPNLISTALLSENTSSGIAVPGGFRRQYVNSRRRCNTRQRLDERNQNQTQNQNEHWNNSFGNGDNSRRGTVKQVSFLESLLENNEVLLYAWIEKSRHDHGDIVEHQNGNRMVFADPSVGPSAQIVERMNMNERILTSNRKTVFTLFKCYVATGILFLPSGFKSAGLVAGVASVFIVGLLSMFSVVLLLRTRIYLDEHEFERENGSERETGFPEMHDSRFTFVRSSPLPIRNRNSDFRFAETSTPLLAPAVNNVCRSELAIPNTFSGVGALSMGNTGKYLVEFSTFFSQVGFCCVYISFIGNVAHNLFESFGSSNKGSFSGTPLYVWMMCTIPIIIPMTWIRYLKHFAIPNLIANVFVVASILYIVTMALVHIFEGQTEVDWSCFRKSDLHSNSSEDIHGLRPKNLDLRQDTAGACFWINPESFPIFLGTVVYTFEGTTMIIPIYNSMKNKECLVSLVSSVLSTITIVFCIFGGVNFFAYGQNTNAIILSNLPVEGTLVVSLLFILVAIFMFPLMIFPAANIVENTFLLPQRRSGKKWKKNFIRTALVFICLFVSVFSGKSIDKLVALIGGLFCVPLALVYPPLFYLKSGCAKDRGSVSGQSASFWKFEIALVIFTLAFGILSTFLSSYYAISAFR